MILKSLLACYIQAMQPPLFCRGTKMKATRFRAFLLECLGTCTNTKYYITMTATEIATPRGGVIQVLENIAQWQGMEGQ